MVGFAESSPNTVAFLCGAASATALIALLSMRKRKDANEAASSEDLVESYLNKRISSPDTSELLKSLTRGTATEIGKSELAPYSLPAGLERSARRQLTDEEIATYNRDGFLLIKQWFSKEEIAVLQKVVESDHQIDAQKISVPDTEGRDTKLTLWCVS
jgi:hypothetical protein